MAISRSPYNDQNKDGATHSTWTRPSYHGYDSPLTPHGQGLLIIAMISLEMMHDINIDGPKNPRAGREHRSQYGEFLRQPVILRPKNDGNIHRSGEFAEEEVENFAAQHGVHPCQHRREEIRLKVDEIRKEFKNHSRLLMTRNHVSLRKRL